LTPTPDLSQLIVFNNFTTYAYLLGPNVLVSPIVEAGIFFQNVTFPQGSDWYSIFDPSKTFKGGDTVEVEVPLSTAAAFAKQGTILPLHVSTALLHNGDSNSSDSYTFVIHTPDLSGRVVREQVRRSKAHGFEISY
jgi:alpha-glucosidase (family GH31 glycosyl hydrolase)